jgi:hypothetical protein
MGFEMFQISLDAKAMVHELFPTAALQHCGIAAPENSSTNLYAMPYMRF